ncbi:hypothetical protein ACJMK2_035525 [Sinanodonta woodiana]|uniref:G-protein coupled receptors family 1 profile domain-containing protein n=1 Tax=Sinanodonta woodiana TaxID=1069815 RepID=A0ABD3WV75_SINWO
MSLNATDLSFTTEPYGLHCYDEIVNQTNETNGSVSKRPGDIPVIQIFLVTSYVLICICGLIGNSLVIYVVLRFTKMKTVTNMYILNLAVSDALFLISLPFLIPTTIMEYWMFGTAMCKIYFVLFSINLFTGVFTLTAMSADRYLAVCHPVRSVNYRTSRMAFFMCLIIWAISFLVMLPIILYSTTVPNQKYPGKNTCTISWPSGQIIPADKAFTWYTFLLGFAIPVGLILVFYVSVILRLRTVGPAKKSKEKKKSHRKVTKMVLAVISVYVICWLPYWGFQVNLTLTPNSHRPSAWQIYLFNGFTVLTCANSMLNPLLYAFLSENFRKSFLKAFKCSKSVEIGKSTCVDNSVLPRSKNQKNNGKNVEKYEFTSMGRTDATVLNNSYNMTVLNDNNTTMTTTYVDKESQTKRNGLEEEDGEED